MNENLTAAPMQKQNARAASNTIRSRKSLSKTVDFTSNNSVKHAVQRVLSDVMTLGSQRGGAHWRNGLPVAFVRQIRALTTNAYAKTIFLLLALLGFQFHASAAQNVTLAWDACTNSSVSGYNLYYGAASHAYTNKVSLGNVTTGTVTGLVKGVTYYFAATALNTSGMESSLSTEISYTIPNPAILSLKMVRTNGAVSVVLTGAGGIPTRWALQATADFRTWNVIARGTNSSVNISIPATGSPAQSYRLAAE